MTITFHKVVVRDKNILLSYRHYLQRLPEEIDEFTIEYKLNEFVGPKVKPAQLFVFNSLITAAAYARELARYERGITEIYECEIVNRKAPHKICYNIDAVSLLDWYKYNYPRKYGYGGWNFAPAGTSLCDEVKLTKLIEVI